MTNQQHPSRFSLFMAELRRRHVWRAVLAYAAVAFVLLQTAEIVLPAFDAPGWALRLLIVLVLLGFPIALAAAWVYEVTPQGIRRERAGGADAHVKLVARLVFLGLTLLTVAFVGWWVVRWTVPVEEVAADLGVTQSRAVRPASGEPGAIHSLAVLPFENFAEHGQQDWFSAGMHEALVAQLSQITSLRVPSRTSVAKYAGTTKTVPEIGRELRVDAIVEGSVLRAEDRVRITVQLIHAATDRHIWSNSYERDFEDVIGLQAEVARAIADEIEAELSPEDQTRFASAERADPEALTAYMKARHEQSKGTQEGLESAVEHYQHAIAEDSSYAPALAGLASAQLLLGLQQPDSAVGLVSSAMSAASKAIQMDPRSAEARDVFTEVQRQLAVVGDSVRVRVLTQIGDSLGAVGVGLGALLDSALSVVRVGEVGKVQPVPGRFEWVAPSSELAYQIEFQRLESLGASGLPTSVTGDRLAMMALRVGLGGRPEEAERILNELLRRDSTSTVAWDALAHLRLAQGDLQGAVEVEQRRAATLGGAGATAEATELQRMVRERGAEGYFEWRLQRLRERERAGEEVSHLAQAHALTGLGRHEEALEQLEQAAAAREPGLALLAVDPTWDELRGEPRFRALMSIIRKPPPLPSPPAPGG